MEQVWKNRENLNKNEIAKLEKDGLAIIDELPQLAKKSFEEIAWDDVERLKWAGIYAQRPKNGLFLIRIKLPSGQLNSKQAKVIAQLAKQYGKNEIQITIRQCIQIHNITLADAIAIRKAIAEVGLTSVGGCGDVPRNILGNPLMGIDPEELFDTTDLVNEAVDFLTGNPEYSNLPRKFKLSISANPHDVGFAGINDCAFVPAVKTSHGETVDGFHVYVGGGLSRDPHLAVKLDFFVKPEETLDFIKTIITIFRDYGFREKRTHCRLKHLVDAWGKEKLQEEILKAMPDLEKGGRDYARKWTYGRFHGFHKQKQDGLYYAGLNVISGMMSADELEQVALLSEKYGDGQLRTTNSQCLLVINLPKAHLKDFAKACPLSLKPDYLRGYGASCTGNKYCNFAPIDTKYYLKALYDYLGERHDFKAPFRINVTGCTHQCAHAAIADLGIVGGKMKKDGVMVDAFTLSIGGALGKEAQFGYTLKGRYSFEEVQKIADLLIADFLTHKASTESYAHYVQNKGSEYFESLIHA